MESLGVIEYKSIPKGYACTDLILKNVKISLFRRIITAPNRYFLMLFGKYDEIQHSIDISIDNYSEHIYDVHILGNIHKEFKEYIANQLQEIGNIENMAVFQFDTIAEAFYATNQFLHQSSIELLNINLSDSVEGRPIVIISGSLSNLKHCCDMAGHGELLSNPDKQLVESFTKPIAI